MTINTSPTISLPAKNFWVKIAQEFLDAANDLPDTQSQIGRITKNIAYAYAAKARLYQAYQQDENNEVVAVDKQFGCWLK